MGKRGPESYMKRQKEMKRKQKMQEKMARRQGKKNVGNEHNKSEIQQWLEKNAKLE